MNTPGGKGSRRRPSAISDAEETARWNAIFGKREPIPVRDDPAPVQLFVHSRTFFDLDLWSAHQLIGEILANGIRDLSLSTSGPEITVRWSSPINPMVRVYPSDTP